MKGLNVKKIAALAAGAVFLGSAVAGAALMSDLAPNTTLVNDNGVPQVTVLIPEAGAASDGVAGARIASKIAYEAYTTKTYTADFSGTPQCEATGEGGETTTTCAVEGQSVTLQIEAPGVAGIYEFSPLIYDVFDKEIGNRDGSKPASTDTYDGDDDEEEEDAWQAVHQVAGGVVDVGLEDVVEEGGEELLHLGLEGLEGYLWEAGPYLGV